MDLLFKRYASPFTLIDQMILAEQFSDFVNDVLDFVENERLWDYYLHKVNGQSFEEFKNSVKERQKVVTPTNIETTVNDSFDILQGFVPE